MNAFNRTNTCLLAAIATLIAGCGGAESNSAPLAATITAAPDARVIDWNSAATIDVLANDTTSRGALTLTAVSGATHGSAVVSAGKIVYTPSAGFFGVEKLNYTIGGEGGASATAEALVTVEAVLTLNGNASDKPIAGGSVQAAIGGRTFSAATNASGDFSLVMRSSAPADFITLVASGSGAQAPVKLASLVGDVATIAGIASKAGTTGQVGMAAVPAIGVTHITTAFMALATKGNGGAAPVTAQQLKDVTAKVDVDDVMRLATAIKLTADNGVALPAGVTDTFAMVNSDASVSAVYAAAAAISPTLASATRSGVEGEVSAPGATFSLDGLAERTIVYRDFTVTYRKDGSGHMSGRLGERDLTWVADGALVRLTYAAPAAYDYAVGSGVQVNGVAIAYPLRETSAGMVILRVLNDATVKYGETGSVVWTSGPDAGKAAVGSNLTTTNAPITLSTAFNVDQRLPVPANLTAVGSVLAGVFANPLPLVDPSDNAGTGFVRSIPASTDMLEFTSATEARFVLSGAKLTWSVQDNYLVLQDKAAGAATWKMALLGTNVSTGQLQWVATAITASAVVTVPFVTETADTPRPLFTDALAVHQFAEVKTTRLTGQPLADHTVSSTLYPAATFTSTWEVTSTGELVIRHLRKSNNSVAKSTRYFPIRWVGKKLTVLTVSGNFSAVTVLEDLN